MAEIVYPTFTEALQTSAKLNYRKINEKLLNREVLLKLCPNGVFESNEFCLGSFKGETGRSLKLNMTSGKWCDFASAEDSKGVGVSSYLSKMWNCTLADATKRASELLDLKLDVKANEIILPSPEGTHEAINLSGKEQLALEGTWKYFDIDSSFIGYCLRFQFAGMQNKVVLPYTYRMAVDGELDGGWTQKAWGDIFPIYGMEKLYKRNGESLTPDTKPVLIVEGEKKCDKAQELFPDYTVIAWCGGVKKVHKVFWTPLTGRKVKIWPDNDDVGRIAASHIAGELGNIGVDDVSIVKLGSWQEKLAEGWDLADWYPDLGMDIKQLLQDAESISTLRQLNNRYIYIITMKKFLDTRDFVRIDKDALNAAHAHVRKKMAESMLESPDLRKVNTITYNPGKGLILQDGPNDQLSVNIWKPFELERLSVSKEELAEEVKPFLNHIAYLMPEPDNQEFYLNYLAHNIQHPGTKIKFCPLIQGVQGIGKSYFSAMMRKLLAHNMSVVSNSELKSENNSWVTDRSFIVIEEAMTMGRREVTNNLKPLITDELITIREKYEVSQTIFNRCNFIMFTNYKDSLALDDSENRFWVYFSQALPKETSYFDMLFKHLDEKYLYINEFLMRRDLRSFKNNARAPQTSHRKEMVNITRAQWQQVIDNIIEERAKPFDKDLFILRSVEEECGKRKAKVPHLRLLGSYLRDRYGFADIAKVNVKAANYPIKNPSVWACRDIQVYKDMDKDDFEEKFNMIVDTIGFM